MTRFLLILLCGCSSADYTGPEYLHHDKPGPVAQAQRDAERKALDTEHAARMRRFERQSWVRTNTPPIPVATPKRLR